jgi:hypothetical protein
VVQSLTPKPKKDKTNYDALERSAREYASKRKPKKGDCSHSTVNHISNGQGGLEVWCNECGMTLDKSTSLAEALVTPVTCPMCSEVTHWSAEEQRHVCDVCESAANEEEHELDTIQRLSEAYRANEREIEAGIKDKEQNRRLGTMSTGPR